MMTEKKLRQAAYALRNGDRAQARTLVDELIVAEPDNAEAWLMLFSVTEQPNEKIDALKQVLRIRPDDAVARQKLHKYKASAEYRAMKADLHTASKQAEVKNKAASTRKEGWGRVLASLGRMAKALFAPRPR